MWSLHLTFQSLCTAASKKLQLDTIVVWIGRIINIPNVQETVGWDSQQQIRIFVCAKKFSTSKQIKIARGEKKYKYDYDFFSSFFSYTSGAWLMSKNGQGAGHDR